jgi:hypothetical protein
MMDREALRGDFQKALDNYARMTAPDTGETQQEAEQ